MSDMELDDKEFQAWAKRVDERIATDAVKLGIERSARRIKAQAMKEVKDRTPVDTGHLSRTWHVTGPFISGTIISLELYNNAEYAPYVESGHRTRTPHTKEGIKRSKGVHWIPGSHMLIKTMFELEGQIPGLLSPSLIKALGGLLD